jgi:hypothetical protein
MTKVRNINTRPATEARLRMQARRRANLAARTLLSVDVGLWDDATRTLVRRLADVLDGCE